MLNPNLTKEHIEDICFFEVNTKYISSSELKTSEFLRVRSIHGHFPIHKAGGENAKICF